MKLHIKKAIILVIIAITCILSFVGCGQKADSQQDISNEANSAGDSQPSNGRGFAQNRPDVYGEVKSVAGNQITIALLEMPQRRELTEEEQQKLKENRQNRQNRQNNSDNQNPNNNDSSNNNNNQNNGQRNNRGRQGGGFTGERKYTGTNETITIQNDTPITTFERGSGNGKREEKKLAAADIKEGAIIQVWYKQDSGDKKEIDSIWLMQFNNNGNNNNNNQ